MELLMMKGKIKFDFLTSASYNFSKNYISGSILSFHFCSDSSIFTSFFPSNHCLTVSILPVCLLENQFFARKFCQILHGNLLQIEL